MSCYGNDPDSMHEWRAKCRLRIFRLLQTPFRCELTVIVAQIGFRATGFKCLLRLKQSLWCYLLFGVFPFYMMQFPPFCLDIERDIANSVYQLCPTAHVWFTFCTKSSHFFFLCTGGGCFLLTSHLAHVHSITEHLFTPIVAATVPVAE